MSESLLEHFEGHILLYVAPEDDIGPSLLAEIWPIIIDILLEGEDQAVVALPFSFLLKLH